MKALWPRMLSLLPRRLVPARFQTQTPQTQTFASGVPPPSAMFYSSDGSGNPGTWIPMSGGGTGLLSGIPPAVGMYYSSDGTGNVGTWVPSTGGGGGGGGGASVTIENLYAAPGSFTFPHNLNSLFYQLHCVTRLGSGYAQATYADYPIDANNAAVIVPAAGDYIATFSATTPPPPNFLVAATPLALIFWPTMTGTQQPVFAVNQLATFGYVGVVTYSTSGLASGMTGAFSPTTITGTGSSSLTLSFPANQAAATTPFTVSGTDGTKTHTSIPSITVGNINQGLVDSWLGTDGSGSSFANSWGTGNTETLGAGSLAWASNAGLPGTTATFSATAYMLGTNQTATNFSGTTPFSVSVWAIFNNLASFHAIISSMDPASTFKGWEISTNTTGLIVWLSNNLSTNGIEVSTAAGLLATGTLYYIVMTYDGSRTAAGVKIYINGAPPALTIVSDTLTASIANTKAVSLGGRVDGTIPLNGLISYVRIYNRVLSAADVYNYYFNVGAR